MSRPFIDPTKQRLVHVTMRVTETQRETLRERGGSAYIRRVLSAPVVTKKDKK